MTLLACRIRFVLAVVLSAAVGMVVSAIEVRAAALEFIEAKLEGEGGVTGLAGVLSVAVSPDGRHVYAVGPSSDAVAVFARDAGSGALVQVEVQRDGVGNVDGIAYASALAISPDGSHLYVAGARDDAVASFARDAVTGTLTFLESHREGVAGVEGIRYARALAISPDGAYLYAAGQKSDAIAVFKRNTLTGWLTFVEVQHQGMLGVAGVAEPLALTVSPDGGHLYVASGDQSAVAVFVRDRTTGRLASGPAAPEGDLGVGIHSIAVSPDGRFLYATRQDDDALVIYHRDRTSGALALADVVSQGVAGVDGLYGVFWVTISRDGRRLYVASTLDHAVAAFERDPATGSLAFLDKRKGAPDRECLAFARSVAVSPDGRHVYVAGASSNAVVAYGAGEADD